MTGTQADSLRRNSHHRGFLFGGVGIGFLVREEELDLAPGQLNLRRLPASRAGLIFTDNVLGVGTMNAVVAAVKTLKAMGSSYQILPERVATISALRGRNAILFGASR